VKTFDLHHGDCLEVLRTLPDNSVDAVVTDPPYGLSFMGKKWDYDVPAVEVWAECLRVLKPGGHLLAFAGTRTQHRMAVRIEDAGFEIRDMIAWVYGSGFPKSHNLQGDWQGWGTALKPALEPITVARKPLAGTVAENVLEYGTGALNIDGCRVPTGSEQPRGSGARESWRAMEGRTDLQPHGENVTPDAGRWPANLIHDGSDEVVSAFPDAKGQQGPISAMAPSEKTSNVYGRMKREGEASASSDNRCAVGFKIKPGMRRLDEGSSARFFYCAKASRSDRNDGLQDPGPQFKHGTTLRQIENTARTGNHHPTVKPTDLMRYLCRLITPPGGVVLDPFMGSGSTGKAAMLEGFCFVGIEREAEYLEIARARIACVDLVSVDAVESAIGALGSPGQFDLFAGCAC